MASPQPAAPLVARFAADLAALTGDLPRSLGLAVSGGPDSVAMLLLAAAALPGRIEAATVDHRLRPESAAEADAVGALCGRLGCPHASLPVTLAGRGGEGLQAAARAARYAALADWAADRGIGHLATAHHADDQAETLLMRLQRGSGIAGLAGIRACRTAGKLVLLRPLLSWRKTELVAIVAAAGIEPADDPSNRDPRFDRVRLRAHLADAPFDPIALARSAATLGEAEAALAWSADRLWGKRIERRDHALQLDPADLPPELLRRLVGRILADFALARPPRGEEVARLIATLDGGGTATLAGVRCAGGLRWRFTPAPPRRSPKGE